MKSCIALKLVFILPKCSSLELTNVTETLIVSKGNEGSLFDNSGFQSDGVQKLNTRTIPM